MFGFFAPARNSRKYRQVYAAYCSHQRQTFGTVSSIFTSYEAVFLYLLALDCGVCAEPSQKTPTCCRMRNDWANHWNINRELADFCGAFAMLLARTKIEDDRRDSKGIVPVIAGRVFRSAFARSGNYFDVHFPELTGQVEQCVADHCRLETDGFACETTDDLRQYAGPTANAFGQVFEAFGTLCKAQQPTVNPLQFQKIGELVGATIITADCMFDFERDQKRGEFTPLKSRGDVAKARTLAMTLAADLGWEVSDIVTRKASLCCPLIMRAVDRIGAFKTEATTKRKTDSPFAIVPKRLSLLTNRAGDCDCGGGECCGALCEGGCGACDCGGGDCGGGNCCDCNGDGVPDCLNGCDAGCYACDCCTCGSSKEKTNSLQAAQTDPDDPLIGQIAEAATPLRPTGFIRLEDRKIPAQIETGSADVGEKVVIVRKGNFGYIVEPKKESQ